MYILKYYINMLLGVFIYLLNIYKNSLASASVSTRRSELKLTVNSVTILNGGDRFTLEVEVGESVVYWESEGACVVLWEFSCGVCVCVVLWEVVEGGRGGNIRLIPAPIANIHACGGLITAVKCDILYIPRLLILNVPP